MLIQVERCIQQIFDGRRYCGYITINGNQLYYEIFFHIPISRLVKTKLAGTIEGVRNKIQITVKKNNIEIKLNDQEFAFFLLMTADFALSFYNNVHNGFAFYGEGMLAQFGIFASIGIIKREVYEFKPELFEMLNSPKFKFGCTLAT